MTHVSNRQYSSSHVRGLTRRTERAMPRILLTQELGMGLWHARLLGNIAAGLRDRGAEVVLAIGDPALARHVVPDGIAVLPSPRLMATTPEWAELAARSYADILGVAGWGNREVLLALARSWDALLTLFSPDLVVVDHAPTAIFAVGGRVPTVHVGMGFTQPPIGLAGPGGQEFPALQAVDEVFAEGHLLQNAAWARARLGREPPVTLSAVLECDVAFATCLSELDPYRRVRDLPNLGPIGVEVTAGHREHNGSKKFFAYLADDDPRSEALIQALAQRGFHGRVWLRGERLGVLKRRDLGHRVQWLDGPLPMAEALADVGFVVHHGGIGIAQEAALAGVPQVLLPRHLEQAMNAAALEGLGIGFNVSDERRLLDLVAWISAERTERRASDYAALAWARAEDDPLGTLVAACLAFV